MAVTPAPKKPQLVKDFWPRFSRRIVATSITVQALLLIVTAGALYAFDLLLTDPLVSSIVLGAQLLAGVVSTIVVYSLAIKPTKHLLDALVHVAGEPTSTPPPNPNETSFEKSGFSSVLKTLYALAASKEETPSETPSEAPTPGAGQQLVSKALDETICGFAIYNKERTIVYSNQATPITVSAEGVTSLDLLFNEHDTLEAWWDECEQSAVHAEKTWPRIPNKLPDEEDRRFFDVIASYNKESDTEMVVTLVDRTHIYSVGEGDLDFIAFAAHELRGPITVIRGYLDVLQDELAATLQPDQQELFRRLIVSSNKLTGYINNILNTSRYDRRHLKMRPVETTIADVYDSIKDDMELRASSQNRLLSVDIPTSLPTVAADIASLGEVFGNLIDNAIKYSGEGGAIAVTGVSKGDMVELSVEDHGIGMPGNVVSNLFQKFYRSHRSRETVAGTGIGLYISKAIVESHGGTISVRSEDGHGSTFTVSLPTYKTVADRIKTSNNDNQALVQENGGGWIKNHTMYRG